MNPTFLLLLGSAAVGALISSVITELGKWRERKSRREELVLAKAAEMTNMYFETMLQFVKDTDQKIVPSTKILEDYYMALKHLLHQGELDPETKARVAASLAGLRRSQQ